MTRVQNLQFRRRRKSCSHRASGCLHMFSAIFLSAVFIVAVAFGIAEITWSSQPSHLFLGNGPSVCESFKDLTISDELKRRLSCTYSFEHMTEVQRIALPFALNRSDLVVRSQTGTGKTLVYLLPIAKELLRNPAKVGGNIVALVICPSRELAQQIADEARRLVGTDNGADLVVMCFCGGVNIKHDRAALASSPCALLVSTPTRLQQHMDDTFGFWERLQSLRILVLDEADQLLVAATSAKTRKKISEMSRILEELPQPGEGRQGLLFSATFPKEVAKFAEVALHPDYIKVDTQQGDNASTPSNIEQSYAFTSIANLTTFLLSALKQGDARKSIVFFVNARVCQCYAQIFTRACVGEILAIHTKISSSQRARVSQAFRDARSGVLFTTDLFARGLDYPDVDFVIQVGAPASRELYIHRLGRAGRGMVLGSPAVGRGLLLLYGFEKHALEQLQDIPIRDATAAWSDLAEKERVPREWLEASDNNCQIFAGRAYIAWLGYYNSRRARLGWSKEELVQQATHFAKSIGAISHNDEMPPPLLAKLCKKMGLDGVKGLNVVKTWPSP